VDDQTHRHSSDVLDGDSGGIKYAIVQLEGKRLILKNER